MEKSKQKYYSLMVHTQAFFSFLNNAEQLSNFHVTINAYLRHINANISKCDVKEINRIRAGISLVFPYPLQY